MKLIWSVNLSERVRNHQQPLQPRLTAAAQKSARGAVQPIVQTYKAGERIVSAGDIITPAQMEALQEFKLIQPAQPIETYLGAAALTVLSAAFIGLYFLRRRKAVFVSEPRSLLMASILFIVFMVSVRFVIRIAPSFLICIHCLRQVYC